MSSLLFPSTLAGVDIKWNRTALDAVHIDEALSGKESRWTGSTWPRYRYECDINILRADSIMAAVARNREWQQFCSHVGRHFGRLDSFLLIDPDDQAVTDMGFAVGNGVAAAFQLQRTLAGDVIDAAGVEYSAQTKPYTNLIKNSSFETDTNADGTADSWGLYDNDSTTIPAYLTIVPGRVAGTKAQRVSWGTALAANPMGLLTSTVPAWYAGQWFTVSFFARGFGTVPGSLMGINFNNFPSSLVTVANPPLTGSWQRYVFQLFWNVGVAVEPSALYIASQTTGRFGDLDFDDVQLTTGQWGVGDLLPLSTPAAAIGTRTPSYWPAYADGFEPITELNGDATIFEEGTWRGRRQLYPYTRTNLLGFSSAFDNAAWVKTAATFATAATTAPDGTNTGEQFSEGATNNSHQAYEAPSTQEVVGDLRCCSIFVKATNLPNIRWDMGGADEGISFNLGTGVIDGVHGASILASGVQTSPLWPGWYRIWFVRRTNSAVIFGPIIRSCANNTYAITSYAGTSRTFFLWGAMVERVSDLNGPTPYIPTPSSAAVTVTDYTLASGVFTPASVPASTVFYSWSGSYYRRARIDMDGVPTNRLAQAMYDAKSIQLVSVK